MITDPAPSTQRPYTFFIPVTLTLTSSVIMIRDPAPSTQQPYTFDFSYQWHWPWHHLSWSQIQRPLHSGHTHLIFYTNDTDLDIICHHDQRSSTLYIVAIPASTTNTVTLVTRHSENNISINWPKWTATKKHKQQQTHISLFFLVLLTLKKKKEK